MRKQVFSAIVACGIASFMSTGVAVGNSSPEVSRVRVAQRPDDSRLVNIRYDLTDADGDTCTIWISVSDNGGRTWAVPAQTVSGHFGGGVTPGYDKLIVWDAGTDMPGKVGNFRVRVWADDGNGPAAKVLVPAGYFRYQNSNFVYVATYMIDKYEVTNQFFCQFLNAGGNDDHWCEQQEINRTSSNGHYYYSVATGREKYPIRYVNSTDAEHFAVWRSQLEGLTYRLPNQYEWEKAAAWDPVLQHYYTYGFHRDDIDCGWCSYDNCIRSVMPVGYFNGSDGRNDAKSYYGCYDMSGNLFEWTTELIGMQRVIRGGNWSLGGSYVACAFRYLYPQSARDISIGFRLVMDAD